ncbi:MAG: shikimate kinase [Parvibaculaceae bacterium]|uniref:shikimate kinase n=1 Tax=Thalassospira sp. TaxID=1912094 RepID=UPI0032F4C7AE
MVAFDSGKNGVTLIGLPGSGKSTVGVQLAKVLARPFVDTDIELQTSIGCSLQTYLSERGIDALRQAEADCIQQLTLCGQVIATGGSAVYDDDAMKYLSNSSAIVFLEIDYETMLERLGDFSQRGIAADLSSGLMPMFEERRALYLRYGTFSVDAMRSVSDVVNQITNELTISNR